MRFKSGLKIGTICVCAIAACFLFFLGIRLLNNPSYKAREAAVAAAQLTPGLDKLADIVITDEPDAQAEDENTEEMTEEEIDLENQAVTVTKEGGSLVFAPQVPQAALIFYPESKVEYTAYAPLMQECAKAGILCVLEKMPLNRPALGVNAAESTWGMKGLRTLYPDLKWYIGGHGMGGTIAAIYAAQHSSELTGIVLLGSYTSKNLYGKGLKLLSVYGSEDKVLDRSRYKENHIYFPEKYKEYEISGGNHSFFGDYGLQRGDGSADVTVEQQTTATAGLIKKFMIKKKKEETSSEGETESGS